MRPKILCHFFSNIVLASFHAGLYGLLLVIVLSSRRVFKCLCIAYVWSDTFFFIGEAYMWILYLFSLSYAATRAGFFGWFCKILHIIKMIFGPKYNGKYLHKIINDLLGDMRVKETLTNVVIPTYDTKCVKPTIFSTFKVQFLNLFYVVPSLIL